MIYIMLFVAGWITGLCSIFILGVLLSLGRSIRFSFRGVSKIPWGRKHKKLWFDFKWAIMKELEGSEVQ